MEKLSNNCKKGEVHQKMVVSRINEVVEMKSFGNWLKISRNEEFHCI